MSNLSTGANAAQNLQPPVETSKDQHAGEGLIQALVQEGFQQTSINALALQELRALGEVCARSSNHLDMMKRLVNALGAEDKVMLKRLLNIMEQYRGLPSALCKLLDVMGTDNPFNATAKAEVRILVPEASTPSTGKSGRKIIGVTGQELTGTVYCVYNPSAPNGETFQSGIMAFQSIFSAFCPERVSLERRRVTKDRRSSVIRAELSKLTLDDLIDDPSLAQDSGSRLIVRNLEVYNALRDAIVECKRRIGELTYSGSMLLSGTNALRVAADPGGQLIKWYERHIQENPNVPKGIVLAFKELTDPDVRLTDIEETNYIRGLVSYKQNHTYISKATALSSLVSDLEVHDSLPAEDPLKLDAALEEARHKVSEELSRCESDMTLVEFGNYLSLAGMTQFREAMNKRLLDTYRAEFLAALKHFEFVTFNNGRWCNDIDGDSVPMTRLREHLYGSKLGYRNQAVLQQKDFKHIMMAERLWWLIPEESRVLTTYPIAQFKEMVEGVIVAYRKARCIDKALETYFRTPEGSGIALDRERVGDSLKKWKVSLPHGQRFVPQEVRLGESSSDRPVLSIAEIAARFLDQKESTLFPRGDQTKAMYTKWMYEINTLAGFGLYDPDCEPFWKAAEDKLKGLVPAADHHELLNKAVSIIANPLVVDPGIARLKIGASKYLWEHSIEVANALVSLEDEIKEASDILLAELPELAEKLEKISTYGTIYCGGTEGNDRGKLHPYLRWLPMAEFLGQVEVSKEYGIKIKYFNAQRLKDALTGFNERYVTLESLPHAWLADAKRICSFAGAQQLQSCGMTTVDRETFLCVKNMTSSRYDYVSREFVDLINRVNGTIQP